MPKKKIEDESFQVSEVKTPHCLRCDKNNGKISSFYKSKNENHRYNSQRVPYCKDCMEEIFAKYNTKYGDIKLSFYYLCRKCDIFYSNKVFAGAESNAKKTGRHIVGCYMQMVSAFMDKNSLGTCFDESVDFLDLKSLEDMYRSKIVISEDGTEMYPATKLSKDDELRKQDCINTIGYDPFADDRAEDRKYLYNTLSGYLDDETIEDPFKLPLVIEIVRILCQINKIDISIDYLTDTSESTIDNVPELSKLFTIKKDMSKTMLEIAKDNGISVNHNGNKSKGSGTLSAIVKKLDQIGYSNANINIFDIATSESMKQISDISNASILKQLNLQDSELYDMISELREVRLRLENNVKELNEKLRLEKVKSSDLENIKQQMEEHIQGLEDKLKNIEESDNRW